MPPPQRFDLEVVFTGVCGLVTDVPLGGTASPTKMHLVLVDGWDDTKLTSRPGVDGDTLPCRHGAMIQFPLDNLPGAGSSGLPSSGQGVWYPVRHAIDFAFEEDPADPHLNDFRVDPGLAGSVADMSLIAPAFASLGGSDVLDTNPHSDVLANAVFTRGELTANSTVAEDWEFEAILSPSKVSVKGMVSEVVLRLRRLASVTITASLFQGAGAGRPGNPGRSAPDVVRLVATNPRQTIQIVIAVGCEENPLRWIESSPSSLNVDDDFRWHYEILSPAEKTRLRTALGANKLPIPRKSTTPGPLAGGRNCFPAFWTT